jgi:hypothetical protein
MIKKIRSPLPGQSMSDPPGRRAAGPTRDRGRDTSGHVRGADLLGPVAHIDADGTIVPATGSYKQAWTSPRRAPGLPAADPQAGQRCSRSTGPATRPATTTPQSGSTRRSSWSNPTRRGVCVRGDTDVALTEQLDRWAQWVDVVFGMDNNPACPRRRT